jgi:hypothetical protein
MRPSPSTIGMFSPLPPANGTPSIEPSKSIARDRRLRRPRASPRRI